MKHGPWIALLPVLLAPLAGAADWNQFRGPSGQGEVPGDAKLPLSWSASQGIVWRSEVPGLGWSSPVVHGDRIYLTTAISANGDNDAPGTVDRSLRAVCLDAATGKLLWNEEVFLQKGGDDVRMHKKNSHASATPLVEDGKLFVHFGPQGTACLGLDGKILWKNDTIHYAPVHGNGGSPVVVGDKLIFSCDGPPDPFVIALNTRNGKVAWRTARETHAKKHFSFSTPLVIGNGLNKELILPGSGNLYSYDPGSGKELWRCNWGEGYSVVPRPVFGHGLIYASSGYDRPVLFAVRPGGKGDVTASHVAWKAEKLVPRNASFVLAGNHLFTVDDKGVGTCYAAATGEVMWQERLGTDTSASPIHDAGRIYVLDEQGTCNVIAASPEFKILATNSLGERALASLAVFGNDLLLRTESALYRIGG